MRILGVVAAALMATACAPKEVKYQVKLVTTSCDPTSDSPFAGVRSLKFRVTAADITAPIETLSPANSNPAQVVLPEIPNGLSRFIEVRAYDGDNGGGGLVSVGRSLPIDIPDTVPESLMGQPIEVTIFLRRIGSFSPIASAASPAQCQRMLMPRAGHTATLLDDGKVLIVGGYNLAMNSSQRLALADVEIFDPGTGTFVLPKSPRMELGGTVLPKAFHTATKLKSGQVLLWGGEQYPTTGTTNFVGPSTIVLVYDPSERFAGVPSRAVPPNIPRTRHSAAIDKNGKVLIVGGLTRKMNTLTTADEVEWYDPDKAQAFVVNAVTLPREGAKAVAIKGGDFIAVAGGGDTTGLKQEVKFFGYTNNEFAPQTFSSTPTLPSPGRMYPAAATLRDTNDLLLVGGYGDRAGSTSLSSSDVVTGANVAMGPVLPTARGDSCAVNLPDGTVFTAGGQTKLPPQGASVSDTALYTASTAGGVMVVPGPRLPVERYAHTCTTLADGSVLVLGGVRRAEGAPEGEILQDAWIYTPAPSTP